MRICVVSQEYPPGYVGGIGTQSQVKAHGLSSLGHEVEVLTAGEEFGPPLTSRDDGAVRVHELRIPGGEFAVFRTETYMLGYAWAVLGAIRSLTEQRPYDVIDFPDYGGEGFAFQLDRQDDDPAAVVAHLHGSLGMFADHIGWPEPGEPLHTVGTFIEDVSIRSADRLLAASASIAAYTAERLGVPDELIDVVGGAVDTEAFSPAPPGQARPERTRMLFVGNIAQNKGIRAVFEAFVALAREFPALALTIAGAGDEAITDELSRRAEREGLADRLEVAGFVEHTALPELYRAADLVVAPSQYEGGMGMVYLEAMACGVPAVAVAAGGAAEAIADGETGILLSGGGAEETTAAVRRLLADPALRKRMGAAARTRALERFAVARYAERVAAAHERAAEQRRASLLAR